MAPLPAFVVCSLKGCRPGPVIWQGVGRRLYKCKRCGSFISQLQDRDVGSWVSLPGNYVIDIDRDTWILAGNRDEFKRAQLDWSNSMNVPLGSIHQITPRTQFHDIEGDTIFLYGTWYNADEVILTNPLLTTMLNRKK